MGIDIFLFRLSTEKIFHFCLYNKYLHTNELQNYLYVISIELLAWAKLDYRVAKNPALPKIVPWIRYWKLLDPDSGARGQNSEHARR